MINEKNHYYLPEGSLFYMKQWGMNICLSIKRITMIQNKKRVPANGIIILILVLANIIAIREGYVAGEKWYWVLVLTLPLLLLAIVNIRQRKHVDPPQIPPTINTKPRRVRKKIASAGVWLL